MPISENVCMDHRLPCHSACTQGVLAALTSQVALATVSSYRPVEVRQEDTSRSWAQNGISVHKFKPVYSQKVNGQVWLDKPG